MKRLVIGIMVLVLAAAGWAARGQTSATSVVNSLHNLSASGPGTVKAAGETEICIFCHTPHNAAPVQPLWNRTLSVTAYKPYTSNSLKALPGQPTGSSKLCLSCHDGTIALGSVISRGQPIQMAGGVTTLPPGRTNLGTDLSDDHPISFKYDTTLVSQNPKLKDPSSLPAGVKLDANNELQCTTCHDAHNNQYGNFLVMANTNSALCIGCHQPPQTDIAAHTLCNGCHQTHTAPSGPYLLTRAKVSDTCLTCHSGATGANQGPNIAQDLAKSDPHDTKSAVNLANHIPNNVDCKDCHEQHSIKTSALGTAPALKGVMGQIDGVNYSGALVSAAQYEYEVCFKCHADKSAVSPIVTRQLVQNNLRLEMMPSAISFHPVTAKGKNTNVPSLRPPLTIDTMIYCTDCHGSETSVKAGGAGPNGPHGSNIRPLLLARYDTADNTPYSTTAYELCFRCHDNTKVVSQNPPFIYHQKHVQENNTPCSVCHTSHGIASAQGTTVKNFALINFDTSVVFPNSTGRLEYNHTSDGHGSCFLKCHNVDHAPKSY